MFKRGIKPYVISSLISYYNQSMALIDIDGDRSEKFKTNLGVKQGGPSSPTPFKFMGYGLIEEIENLKSGISIGRAMVDIIIYADGTLLVTDSSSNMEKMIKILENYAATNELEINVKKTFMLTTNRDVKRFLYLIGELKL